MHDPVVDVEPQIGMRTFEMARGLANVIQNSVAASLGRAEPIAPIWHGVEIARILESIYESARKGRGAAGGGLPVCPLPARRTTSPARPHCREGWRLRC